jgi:hypothetical protein
MVCLFRIFFLPISATMAVVPSNTTSAVNGTTVKRKEIYKYEAPWNVYAMNWSVRPDKKFRLAVGSFIEEYSNKVQVIQLDEESGEFTKLCEIDHPYPSTKVMWMPDSVSLTKQSSLSWPITL